MGTMDLDKFINVENIDVVKKYIEIFADFYVDVIYKHHYDVVSTQREADARIIFQMFFSKALHFKHMLEGVEYKGDQFKMNSIVDPTLLFTLVRNQYECLCLFELINVIPDSDDKKSFLSLMHQISGLKYRQRFVEQATLQANIKKLRFENIEINQDVNLILSSSVFHKLNPKSQDKVRKWIKDKEYQLFFKNDEEIQKLGWKDFANKFGMKKDCVDNLYTYFCMNAHPSYPSIMQFRDAFAKDNPEFLDLALFASHTFLIFLSVFLVDYMQMFPAIVNDFKKLDEDKRMLLTAFNDIFREEKWNAKF